VPDNCVSAVQGGMPMTSVQGLRAEKALGAEGFSAGLRAWKGLGYDRAAVEPHDCAGPAVPDV